MRKSFSPRRVAVAAVGGACIAAGLFASPAIADSPQQLMPDPDAYCVISAPYEAQVNDLGWVVQYAGLRGDANQNDWQCTYSVAMTIPANVQGDTFSLPPTTQSFPIDWAAMCAQQYNGSSLQWVGVLGPEISPGPFGAPWMCIGASGAMYDQTETPNGPVGRVG